MQNRVSMVAGERRRITVRVTYNGRPTGFTIVNPRYTLKSGYQELDSGIPALEYSDMTCVIAPSQAGNYVLEFTFEIGGEIWIQRVYIAVRE